MIASLKRRVDILEQRRGSNECQRERRREQSAGLAAEAEAFAGRLTEAAGTWSLDTLLRLPAVYHWAWSLRFDAAPLSLVAVIQLHGPKS